MRTLHRVLATIQKSWKVAEQMINCGLDVYNVYLIDPMNGRVIETQSYDNYQDAMFDTIILREQGLTITTDFESLV